MARTKNEVTLSYPERLDIPQVTLAEAKEQILLSAECQQGRGVWILVGESGVGKTQIFQQICKELRRILKVIHAANFNMMSGGIPRKAEGGFFDIAVPSSYPQEGEPSLMLFDELNRGSQMAIDQFFTLLEDRGTFDYRLPDNCLVVGTMNPSNADYAVTRIEGEPALRRRVKFLFVVPDFTGWFNYAKTEKFHSGSLGAAKGKPCHPQILDYFKANPKLLYDEKARDQGKQYICPATIETISEDAYNTEWKGFPLYGTYAGTRFGASIGTTGTTQLLEFIKDSTVMLGATDILGSYTKSAQKAVKKLTDSGHHEKLTDLCENVLALLFAEKPSVKKTVPSFLGFCNDLPEELTSNMLFQLSETAKQAGAQTYLIEFTDELQEYPVWTDMQLRLDTNHRKIDESLQVTQ